MTTRTASCACGKLTAQAAGEPDFVVACHCIECQRRTGSVFGVGAYYPRAQVTTAGTHRVYARAGQDGREVRMCFCPDCGSTVFWDLDLRPNHIAIAVGTMADPAFPAPIRSVWEQSRHPWLEFNHDIGQFLQQFTPPAK